jgi:outer membrane protein assembly factor BamB
VRNLLLASLAIAGCASTSGDAGDYSARFVAPTSVLEVRWRRHLVDEPLIEYKPQEFASAATDGQHVFIGSSAGDFYSFAARDGALVWRARLGAAIASRPLYVAGESTIFVGTQGGALFALDARTGGQRWRYDIKGPIESQPTFVDGMLYFTSGENRVYAIDAQKGTWKWQYDREAPESFTIRGYAAPLVANGRVYVGFSDGYLACLSAASGDVVWTRSLAGEATRFVDVDSTPTLIGDVLYVASFSGGVYALEPKDGSTRWRYDVEGATTVRARNGRLYFTAAKYGLHCLDRDGHLLWRQALASEGELSPPLIVGSYVLANSAGGGTYVVDAHSGRLYQYFAPGHGITGEAVSDGRQVYVLSNGGYFYALAIAKRPS